MEPSDSPQPSRWFAGVTSDIEYLQQTFADYYGLRLMLDFVHAWALYVASAVVSEGVRYVCRASAKHIPLHVDEAHVIVAVMFIIVSVFMFENSFDSEHFYKAHEVLSWIMWGAGIVSIFDVTESYLLALKAQSPSRRLVPATTLFSLLLGAFAVRFCGEWKLDGGSWGVHSRSPFWQALGYSSFALSAALLVVPLWLTIQQFAVRNVWVMLGTVSLGTLMILSGFHVADVRFGTAHWLYAPQIIFEIASTFAAIFGGLFLYFASFKLMVRNLRCGSKLHGKHND